MTTYCKPTKTGSAHDDVIVIAVPKFYVEEIVAEFCKLALRATDYLTQGVYREVKDFFQEALDSADSGERRIYHDVTCPRCNAELDSVVGSPQRFLAWCPCGCIFVGSGTATRILEENFEYGGEG